MYDHVVDQSAMWGVSESSSPSRHRDLVISSSAESGGMPAEGDGRRTRAAPPTEGRRKSKSPHGDAS
eukprot:9466245-Pyramimonas_sp.AAC.1